MFRSRRERRSPFLAPLLPVLIDSTHSEEGERSTSMLKEISFGCIAYVRLFYLHRRRPGR